MIFSPNLLHSFDLMFFKLASPSMTQCSFSFAKTLQESFTFDILPNQISGKFSSHTSLSVIIVKNFCTLRLSTVQDLIIEMFGYTLISFS